MQVIDKLAWVEIADRKLLGALSHGKDLYYLPGGKREEGETDGEALAREIREELSVDLLLPTLESFGTFRAQAHGKAEGVEVQMICYRARYRGEIRPAAEIASIAWLQYEDRERSSPAAQLVLDELKRRDLID